MNKPTDVRVENWLGVKMRFVEVENEWYVLLNDVSVAFGESVGFLMNRLDDDLIIRVDIDEYNVLARDLDIKNEIEECIILLIFYRN